MIDRSEAAAELAVAHDGQHDALRRTGPLAWESDRLRLRASSRAIPAGIVYQFELRNRGESPVSVERVQVLELEVAPAGDEVRFLRFGLNMPGDPVYFGVLRADDPVIPFPRNAGRPRGAGVAAPAGPAVRR